MTKRDWPLIALGFGMTIWGIATLLKPILPKGESDSMKLVELGVAVLSAFGTIAAAIFAAVSAKTSKDSAEAARGALDEARLARRDEVTPRIILERDFFDLSGYWPHKLSLNSEPVYLSRAHWKDENPKPPTFLLQNFGQSPAIEISIVWELSDSLGDYALSERYSALGVKIENFHYTTGTHPTLIVPSHAGGESGTPLYRRWTTQIASCSPNQKRIVDFPSHLLCTIFTRGLQVESVYYEEGMTLKATIFCHALDGTEHKTQFRWKIRPFTHGQINPIVVNTHISESPLYSKPKGPLALSNINSAGE